MSRISRKNTQQLTNTLNPASVENTEEEQVVQEQPEESSLSFSEQQSSEENTVRVVFEANASADQLARGHVVRLAGAKDIFKADREVDYSKGIITGITCSAIYSDCSEPVTVSNLFNASENQPNVQNEQGWLHAPNTLTLAHALLLEVVVSKICLTFFHLKRLELMLSLINQLMLPMTVTSSNMVHTTTKTCGTVLLHSQRTILPCPPRLCCS